MGTLFDQPPRADTLEGDVVWLRHVAEKLGYKLHEIPFCDLVQTALKIQSADVLDVQLGGFGKLLEQLIEVMECRDDEA